MTQHLVCRPRESLIWLGVECRLRASIPSVRRVALFVLFAWVVRVDALALDCLPEVEHARKIVTGGTSAHRQLAVYNQAIEKGADKKQALEKVVDLLIEETVAGL